MTRRFSRGQKTFGALALLWLVLGCGLIRAEDPRVTALLKRGEAAEKAGHTREALAAFQSAEQIIAQTPVLLLLRISQQYSDLIEQAKSPSEAEMAARQSLAYAQRALALDPQRAAAHLAVALAYGKITDFVDNQTKLQYSKFIRDEATQAIALDPTDDMSWHVLGRWHAEVAQVNFLLKAMVRLIYGSLPPASLAKGAEYLQKATQLAPRRVLHHAELARIEEKLGHPDLAEKEWLNALKYPAADRDEEDDQRDAQKALGRKAPAPPRSAARW